MWVLKTHHKIKQIQPMGMDNGKNGRRIMPRQFLLITKFYNDHLSSKQHDQLNNST